MIIAGVSFGFVGMVGIPELLRGFEGYSARDTYDAKVADGELHSLQHTLQHTLQLTLQHMLQHMLQHTLRHAVQHILRHAVQHTLQHALQRIV